MSESGKSTQWEGTYLRAVREGRWEYVERKRISGIVGVLALTEDRKLLLIEQHRVPVHGAVIELPAGLVGDDPGHGDEPFEAAARRELIEETGYEPGRLERLFDGVVSAGMSDERMTYFLATGCRKVGPGGGDGSEKIAVHEVPLAEVLQFIAREERDGKLVDIKAAAMLRFWLAPPRV